MYLRSSAYFAAKFLPIVLLLGTPNLSCSPFEYYRQFRGGSLLFLVLYTGNCKDKDRDFFTVIILVSRTRLLGHFNIWQKPHPKNSSCIILINYS